MQKKYSGKSLSRDIFTETPCLPDEQYTSKEGEGEGSVKFATKVILSYSNLIAI